MTKIQREARWEECAAWIWKAGTLPEAQALAKKAGFSAPVAVWISAMGKILGRTVEFTEFQRGAIAAAALADEYNMVTTHEYRLGDCILSKLNIRKRPPRRNRWRM